MSDDIEALKRQIAELQAQLAAQTPPSPTADRGATTGPAALLEGVQTLLQRLGQEHAAYRDALLLEYRLGENIQALQRIGDTAERRAERTEIIDSLNAITLKALQYSFGSCSAQRCPPMPCLHRRCWMRFSSATSSFFAGRDNITAGGNVTQASRDIDQSTHYHLSPPDPAATERQQAQQHALHRYLDYTCGQCNALALGQLDTSDAAHQRALQLDRVYIALHTTTQIETGETDKRGQRETRPLTALETLWQRQPARTMLLGAPGSGKSTFVNHLAFVLGRAVRQATSAHDLSQTLPRWSLGPLLPIRVILRDLADFALSQPQQTRLALLHAFLEHQLSDLDATAALPLLHQALHEQNAVLLFDGLDEVVGQPVLRPVTECITAAAHAYPHSPVLVTCRVLDYEREPARQLPGFATYTLAGLDNDQIETFVQHWYAELAASGRRDPAHARDDASRLQAGIAARPELRDLAPSPMLLTVMALVHASIGRLPDAEALLYHECIEVLLLRWRQRGNQPDVLAQLALPALRASDLLVLMARLGWSAHEQADPGEAAGGSGSTDLSKHQVIGTLAEGFATYDSSRAYALAEQLFALLEQGNGLLLQRGPDQYAFPHRTFQEFLAGYHLKRQKHYHKLSLERAEQPHWQKALLLMVGHQVLNDGELEKPLDLAAKLLAGRATSQVLAGELLLIIGRERASSYDEAFDSPTEWSLAGAYAS
ncbi:MAG: NACHT domain-containing protein [Chloroflexaceae bacterium]|nr:NACHT domain-containing protein [Chloroflexaceae bacterium]